jgi:hypothetical protein
MIVLAGDPATTTPAAAGPARPGQVRRAARRAMI